MKSFHYDSFNQVYYYQPTSKRSARIVTSLDAYEYLHPFYSFTFFTHYREKFIALYLDKDSKPVSWKFISTESRPFVMVDFKELLEEVKITGAERILIAHNSVTNNTKPTEQDDDFTKALFTFCKEKGILLKEHLIISEYGKYFSYADEGRL